ncbi:MAG TPA: hypothetical protein VJU79_01795 [Candidatus Dormibacteraeota bacterium]|nr:hypothetical protein [Candidatus Dormibacteraeota bacterium]
MTAVLAPEARPAAAPRRRGRLVEMLVRPRSALLAAVLLAVGSVGFDALGDPDVWWHIRLGRWILDHGAIPNTELFSYTAHGNPLTAHEWLTDSLFTLLNGAGGLFLVALFVGFACWSGFVAIALRARQRGAGLVSIALGLALGAKAAAPVLGARPQVLTFVLLCWTLWLVDSYLRNGGRRLWLLPAMFLLWANLHAGFIAGLVVLAIVIAAELTKHALRSERAVPAGRIRALAIATGAAAIAACINPAGPSLYRFALSVSTTEGKKAIVEWMSPNFHDPGMWALLALIGTFVVLAALGGRPDLRDALLAAAGIALALTAVRDTAICVALALPAWIVMAAQLGRRWSRNPRQPVRVGAMAVAAGGAIVLCGATASAASISRMSAQATASGVAAAYPSCATRVLSTAPAPQRVFAAYGSAGYVINALAPAASVYEYGESISLGFTVFDHYQRIAAAARTAPSALSLLDSSQTTAVLYPRGELTALLDSTPGWHRVLKDPSGAMLYVHGDSAWASGAHC